MKNQKLTHNKQKPAWRSPCPIARALDIVGDKWTLLVVRDLVLGKQTYTELQSSPEKIPTNILADRLRRLEQHGLLKKRRYQAHPPRYSYHLTPKGQALGDALHEIVEWGLRYIPGSSTAGTKE